MPVYKDSITRAAERDVEGCVKYLALESRQAAGKWLDELLDRIGSLEKYPMRAPRIPESIESGETYRHLESGKYRIVFRIRGKAVVIIRVIHAARLLDLDER